MTHRAHRTARSAALLSAGALSAAIVAFHASFLVAFLAAPRITAQDAPHRSRFAQVLQDAQIDLIETPLAELADVEAIGARNAFLLHRIFYRVASFDADSLTQWVQTGPPAPPDAIWQQGSLVRVEGSAQSCAPLHVDQAARLPNQPTTYYRCKVVVDDHVLQVITPAPPLAWRKQEEVKPIDEPVTVQGVVIGLARQTPRTEWVIAALHLEWYPQHGVSSGVQWLAAHGMDASLWDDVVPRGPFVDPRTSREADAFYTCLALNSQATSGETMQFARQAILESLPFWEAESAETSSQVAALRRAAQSDAAPPDPDAEKQIRRRAASVEQGLRAAEAGRTAFAPLYLRPERFKGDWVLFEGTARRAVRIAIDPSKRSGIARRPESGRARPSEPRRAESRTTSNSLARDRGSVDFPDAYFEVDLYTSDSQNMPVVCCVARLPRGFPQGDAIHEPIRVAGHFFKCWRYRRRSAASDESPLLQGAVAPLVVGGGVEWIRVADADGAPWGLYGGVAFLAVLGFLWRVALRHGRRGRLARTHFSVE